MEVLGEDQSLVVAKVNTYIMKVLKTIEIIENGLIMF